MGYDVAVVYGLDYFIVCFVDVSEWWWVLCGGLWLSLYVCVTIVSGGVWMCVCLRSGVVEVQI